MASHTRLTVEGTDAGTVLAHLSRSVGDSAARGLGYIGSVDKAENRDVHGGEEEVSVRQCHGRIPFVRQSIG